MNWSNAARPTLELVKWSNATRPALERVKRDTIKVERGSAGRGLTLSGETGYWSKNRILVTAPYWSNRILAKSRILVTTPHWSNRILVKQSARQDRVTGAEVGVIHFERRRRLPLRARARSFVRSFVCVRFRERERGVGGGRERGRERQR